MVAYQWDIRSDRVRRMRGSIEPGTALEDAGTFEDVVRNVLPQDQARFRADIAAALESEDGLYRTEIRYRRRDGEVRWLSETGRAVRGPDGRPQRMVGITFDITAQKEVETALREAQALLREQSDRKDEFLAMLAHELRNPLAPIRNAVHILRLIGPAEGTAAAARDMVDRQVAHLVRLVDDLLDVSRVSRGKITLQKADLDLREVVHHALEVSGPLLAARGHRLDSDMPAEPVRVHGDFTRLSQAVTNLLNNAAKYTDAGGDVRIALQVEGTEAVVRVRDTGRGLDATAVQRVFELFYQAERDLDRAEGGLGLGLSLVRSLVELHGGRAEAASPGRGLGSTFTVRLPLLQGTGGGTGHGPAAAEVKPPRTLRVLVVDDLADSAESMAQLLRLDGHEVSTAFDGRVAVEIALRERPEVVLLDIGLPTLNGYQACRAMREGGLTDAFIAALTGYGQAEDRRLSQVAGFDEHLVKPVELTQIMALVAKRAARSS